jgi:hypothetical protein
VSGRVIVGGMGDWTTFSEGVVGSVFESVESGFGGRGRKRRIGRFRKG